ncbi:MAG: hypothetical protein IJA97_01445 [Clostridia bacterium]|nr:hypothetical protein [Clostridia bacterium]
MSKIVTISNDYLSVDISTLGAEIVSIKYMGKERIWQGSPVWQGHAPILFPINGCVYDGYYEIGGEKFEMKAHGFARKSEYKVVTEEKTTATFLLESSLESKKVYPFDFKFRVMFKIACTTVQVYYIVENHGDTKMYYNVGCHEGYLLDGKVSEYSIKFDGDEKSVQNSLLTDNFINEKYSEVAVKENGLNLGDFFIPENDGESIIVENIKSKRATLCRGDKEEIAIYYSDFPHLVLWTEGDEPFIAIEPWTGLPDVHGSGRKIEDKKSIATLDAKSSKTFYHSITFLD